MPFPDREHIRYKLVHICEIVKGKNWHTMSQWRMLQFFITTFFSLFRFFLKLTASHAKIWKSRKIFKNFEKKFKWRKLTRIGLKFLINKNRPVKICCKIFLIFSSNLNPYFCIDYDAIFIEIIMWKILQSSTFNSVFNLNIFLRLVSS